MRTLLFVIILSFNLLSVNYSQTVIEVPAASETPVSFVKLKSNSYYVTNHSIYRLEKSKLTSVYHTDEVLVSACADEKNIYWATTKNIYKTIDFISTQVVKTPIIKSSILQVKTDEKKLKLWLLTLDDGMFVKTE